MGSILRTHRGIAIETLNTEEWAHLRVADGSFVRFAVVARAALINDNQSRLALGESAVAVGQLKLHRWVVLAAEFDDSLVFYPSNSRWVDSDLELDGVGITYRNFPAFSSIGTVADSNGEQSGVRRVVVLTSVVVGIDCHRNLLASTGHDDGIVDQGYASG